jgi:hypothetical protein
MTWALLVLAFLIVALWARDPVIPKRIWSYWDTPTPPPQIAAIHEARKRAHPDWDVVLLNEETLASLLDRAPPPFETPQHRADWIRLYLLDRFGGVWLDASIITNQPIDALRDQTTGSALGAYYLEARARDGDPRTFIENWCLIAPPRSPLVRDWLREYEYAASIGFLAYKRRLQDRGLPLDTIFGDADDVYLTQHACLQSLLAGKDQGVPITLFRAEDDMYKLHLDCEWNSDCIRRQLAAPAAKQLPYIKLRGIERPEFDAQAYFSRI